ncbi:MAG: carbohydrate-binding protein [Bacteroidales bacterium]|nr:carbohydrate-binding protein [Bacteroidales bacterium]
MKYIISFISIIFFFNCLLAFGNTKYEAEDQVYYKAVIETKNAGYEGAAYINFDNETGGYLEFTVGMAADGIQSLTVRFANGGTLSRPMEITVNGTVVEASISFEVTGEWTTWLTKSFDVNLQKGVNLIRFTSTGSEGGPNIDNLEVTGEKATSYFISTTAAGPGTIRQQPAGDSLFAGQEVVFTASPSVMAEFTGWTGDTVSASPVLQFNLEKNITLTASFTEKEVKIDTPNFKMTGYANVEGDGLPTTTGGQGGLADTVSTLVELVAYANTREDNFDPGILYIKGKIESPEKLTVSIKHGANISIIGVGKDAELHNVGLKIWDYNNVIVRNLTIHEVFYPEDAITIDECHHVWIDHCELYSKIGEGIGVDTYDGLLDIKNGSRYVTVSWNYIHHHMKTSLIGHTDNSGQAETDRQFKITYHHNYFSNTDGRNPSLRFGALHMFNNYLENITDYGLAVRQGAHSLVENNHFESVKIPVTTNKFSGDEGFVCMSGNIYTGTCSEADNSITQTDCEFWNNLPYQYTLDSVHKVALLVQMFAGAGVLDTVTAADPDTTSAPVGIREISITGGIEISSPYPNPAESVFSISIKAPEAGTSEVILTDMGGKTVKKYPPCNYPQGNSAITFEKGALQPGIYLCIIRFDKYNIIRKVTFR